MIYLNIVLDSIFINLLKHIRLDIEDFLVSLDLTLLFTNSSTDKALTIIKQKHYFTY